MAGTTSSTASLHSEPEGASGTARHPWRDLVVLAVPQVILLGGMGVMLVVHPNAVRSGVMSTRAVVVNGVLLGAWVLLSFVVLPRLVRNVFVRAAILTAGALAAVVVLVLPTLRDTKVVERFPVVAAPAPERATTPAGETTEAAGAASASTAPAEPVRVSWGELVGIDHDATGRASVYRQPDGSLVVALEGIDVEPGPDYRVIVVPTPDATRPADGHELDALRGNQGTQYYAVPRDVGEVGVGWTVLIWCRAFGVPVANANQHPS